MTDTRIVPEREKLHVALGKSMFVFLLTFLLISY